MQPRAGGGGAGPAPAGGRAGRGAVRRERGQLRIGPGGGVRAGGQRGDAGAAVTPALRRGRARPAPLLSSPPPGLRELPPRLDAGLGSLPARCPPVSAVSPPAPPVLQAPRLRPAAATRLVAGGGGGGARRARRRCLGHGAGAGGCGGEVPPPPRSEGRPPKPERPRGRFPGRAGGASPRPPLAGCCRGCSCAAPEAAGRPEPHGRAASGWAGLG